MHKPKQERAIQTRAAILRAAAEVFDECGYTGASISKIIARAGLTQGAVYFHFASKEEMARAVMLEQANNLRFPDGVPGLQHLVDLTMFLAVQLQEDSLLRAGVRLAVEQGEIFGNRDDTAYRDWVERFAADLYAATGRSELLPDVVVPDLAQFLVGAYSGTQLFSNISTGRADLPQRLVVMWRYLLPGIATPEARARMVVRPWGAARP
ncbi:TetR/AcrR family transcriptional regulator [Kitasatospora sp. NA04385]|uniref:ScbR family autoregulator-binding transcription factor n=1 Tax=Kitasatospora sp. NA04385 TaxID=2742135 RepID=UPI0015927A51|nr:ScbR family autoregulator-binding transcription factor [Kitasatospora sp. NA04385]QKW21208.1 TetR/AcrR family transcriptional regulator [Kitasatospora sp. NA04385]